ncbi:AIM24 family protein [Seinonella peptonophila]|nr:AIM24 family protein [Seinonella peptonophila]
MPISTDGARLKQVRVILDNGTVVTETGALQQIQGHISSDSHQKQKNLFHKLTLSRRTKTNDIKPAYQGRGELYLEPDFCHYFLHKLDNEEIIVDHGMFYCCESTIRVSPIKPKKVDNQTYITQTKLSGTGICVLRSPIPESQILKFELYNERLQIEPGGVILRSASLQSPMQNLRNLFQSFTGRTEALETFTGTGQIWVAPTLFLNRIM